MHKHTKAKVTRVRPADENNQVLTVEGGSGAYRRKPCADCPWRRDAVGKFPAEAFRHAADTAYDMAQAMFGCHDSGPKKPATCAGFLLRGAQHNLGFRIDAMNGWFNKGEVTTDVELFDSYREMAVANGVDPDDPVLRPCRP